MDSKTKSIEQQYRKYKPREHIYQLPDTYIGSIEHDTINTWVVNHDDTFIEKSLTICPGF